MSDNIFSVQESSTENDVLLDGSELSLDELESQLDAELETQLSDLELLKEEREKIGNPDSI